MIKRVIICAICTLMSIGIVSAQRSDTLNIDTRDSILAAKLFPLPTVGEYNARIRNVFIPGLGEITDTLEENEDARFKFIDGNLFVLERQRDPVPFKFNLSFSRAVSDSSYKYNIVDYNYTEKKGKDSIHVILFYGKSTNLLRLVRLVLYDQGVQDVVATYIIEGMVKKENELITEELIKDRVAK